MIIRVALASVVLGTVMEASGPVTHRFWLHNDDDRAFAIRQTYPSCDCTSISPERLDSVSPGDSVAVDVTFNPRGKGGEFYETATIVLQDNSHVTLSIEGDVVTSEETLRRMFPRRVDDSTYCSLSERDLGVMAPGQKKTVRYSLLRLGPEQDWNDTRQEYHEFEFQVPYDAKKGVQSFLKEGILLKARIQ